MENKQYKEGQSAEWISTWSQFIRQKPFSHASQQENSSDIIEQVLEAIQQGDSCISATQAQADTLNDLVVSVSNIQQQIAPFVYEDNRLYLYRYWALEQSLAQQVARLKQQNIEAVDISAYPNLLTDEHQIQALSMVAKQALNIITGGPGTGKTYTLARIIAVLNQALPNIRIAMAAPTGKAAQRMKEALQNSLNDEKLQDLVTDDLKQLNPITIHRLLGLGTNYQPRFHAKQPLPYDVIVVDEASMLDLSLANMLLSAVPDQARLILLGDADQLAAVDVGSVLADLQLVPALAENRVNLVTSRRFKEGALIGQMAEFIQAQQPTQNGTALLEKFAEQVVHPSEIKSVSLQSDMEDQIQLEYLPQHMSKQFDRTPYYDKLMLGYQPYIEVLKSYLTADEPELWVPQVVKVFDDYRILAAIRHGALGLTQLNLHIEQRLLDALSLQMSKQGDWYVGRPVMMTYNDYQLGLSNGDIGICFKRSRDGQSQFEVYFPSLEKWVPATRLPKSIETAFVLTIHKSQGSEFTHTAVVLDETAKDLLSKELLYTAITRAKKVVSLLADQDALVQSLTVKTMRKSGLLEKVNNF
ncbi:exodeoxyribonuclease V subunit alpha [Acinetobacter sp. ANC 4862]|uniref:exodeoxyribonuclease V subunit alpha n=1 Tax=Acinetobacter sp. ANC 4862 TaxID=2529849 RepID=UPI00103EA5F6|nr:exodeoxyribonuclease V subunit alpha [Acinetobacter sp. ANC 4862]TCH64862.1 exodeoxyribonuclease V subunit alpha [Acinetobacter sp. ANC 4862]